MTCGFQGPEPKGTFNVHYVGVKKIIRQAKRLPRKLRYIIERMAYKDFHYSGGALGKFIKTVRLPDFNIITADWIGWGSRRDIRKSSRPRAILASRDPVALDFVAAKEILLKSTPENEKKYLQLNDPTIKNGPFWKFLKCCNDEGIGNIDPARIKVFGDLTS